MKILFEEHIIIIRGRKEDSMKNLCYLRDLPSDNVQDELKVLATLQKEMETTRSSCSATITRLLDKTVLIPMAIISFLFFTQSFGGSNMVAFYTVIIFQVS